MPRGTNMNLCLHLKWLFKNAFKLFFTTSRAERYSAYKMKVSHSQYQRTSDFTSTMTSKRKCSSYSEPCRPISAILCMLNGCSVVVPRKLRQSVTNEQDELKL